jgi:AcrR family transcriptional regulator
MAASANRKIRNVHQQVLGTAIRLFTEQGYFNTSVPAIVRESGVSTGSIYHHFGDKEGVAIALFNNLVERMEKEFDDIEHRNNNAHDRCRAIIELLFEITEKEPEVMSFMLFVKHKEFMPGMAPVCSSRPFKQMRAMVSRGMGTGEVKQLDEMVAASSIFGGALRLISLRLDGVLENSLEHYIEEIWDCAWRSVSN